MMMKKKRKISRNGRCMKVESTSEFHHARSRFGKRELGYHSCRN
jgi:hypothetical protein